MSKSTSNPKPTGTPFAGASSKPWLVKSPTGLIPAIAKTITILFRKNFGERYLNPLSLLKGMACFAAYLLGMRWYAVGGKHSIEIPVPIFSWLTWLAFAAGFLVLASIHMFAAVRRREMFRDEYSHSGGRPWGFWLRLPLVNDEWDFERFYEPVIIIGAGALLVLAKNWFGPYLIIAGVCAFFVARSKHKDRRELELNVLDTQTEASNVPRFDAGPTPQPVKPVAVASPSRRVQADDSDPFERLKANNPDLAKQIRRDTEEPTEGGQ